MPRVGTFAVRISSRCASHKALQLSPRCLDPRAYFKRLTCFCVLPKKPAAKNGGVDNKPEGQNSAPRQTLSQDKVLKFTDPVR